MADTDEHPSTQSTPKIRIVGERVTPTRVIASVNEQKGEDYGLQRLLQRPGC